jgi:hypothetical protein
MMIAVGELKAFSATAVGYRKRPVSTTLHGTVG